MAEKKQSRKKDAYTIVLENIHSDFRVFGEGLSLIREEVKGNSRRLDKVDERLSKVDERLSNLETEVALIRHNQVTRDEFKFLETRVLRIERKLK